jgi:hypothetical protein
MAWYKDETQRMHTQLKLEWKSVLAATDAEYEARALFERDEYHKLKKKLQEDTLPLLEEMLGRCKRLTSKLESLSEQQAIVEVRELQADILTLKQSCYDRLRKEDRDETQ